MSPQSHPIETIAPAEVARLLTAGKVLLIDHIQRPRPLGRGLYDLLQPALLKDCAPARVPRFLIRAGDD